MTPLTVQQLSARHQSLLLAQAALREVCLSSAADLAAAIADADAAAAAEAAQHHTAPCAHREQEALVN